MSEMLQEFVDSRGVTMRVDPGRGVLRGVKMLGLQSRNGRTYLAEALTRAAPLYEGAKVNVNHPKASPLGPRDYQDRLGLLRNVAVPRGRGAVCRFPFQPEARPGRAVALGRGARPARTSAFRTMCRPARPVGASRWWSRRSSRCRASTWWPTRRRRKGCSSRSARRKANRCRKTRRTGRSMRRSRRRSTRCWASRSGGWRRPNGSWPGSRRNWRNCVRTKSSRSGGG